METATRTVYGGYVQTSLLLGTVLQYPANSTLNEKLGINAGVLPDTSTKPSLSYWAIGNGGHQLTVGADGIALPTPVQHRGTDAALYSQFPFVLRALNNDLTAQQRAVYALRRQEMHNGVSYIAYYGKRLDKTNVTPQMQYKVVANGVETTTPFVPNSSNLNPTPPVINNTGVNTVDGDYTVASGVLSITLTPDEVTELLNAATIIWGDPKYAIISEIALCTGVDKAVTVAAPVGGGSFQFLEAVGVQVTTHVNAMIPANFSNNGVSLSLDVGSVEPLVSINS